ncbi:P-loop containing nucleoside triphosphate hydrolase protein [Glonium stellatum]|uniref:P-loop containing nucleoside triphosphate hydrolase protein n=1 Tax=Glonium stellatum TaxID=574774 RepID=A0A8E2FE64_9PEZI|nr:P-loop containing nucleoside triphosphate hydrolase protein [Glonium stellatum]
MAGTSGENLVERISNYPKEKSEMSGQNNTAPDDSTVPIAKPLLVQNLHPVTTTSAPPTKFYHMSTPQVVNEQLQVLSANPALGLDLPPPPPLPPLGGLTDNPTAHRATVQPGDIFPSKPTTYVVKLGYAIETRDLDGKTVSIQRFDGPQLEQGNAPVPILEYHIVRYESSDIEVVCVNIHSTMLINVLRSIVRYTDENLDGNKVQLVQPYKLIYSHEDELRNFKNNHPETHSAEYKEECDKHVDFLLKFLDDQERLGRGLWIEKARWKNIPPMATFKNLWLLLRPGDLASVDRDDALEPYIIRTITGGPLEGVARLYTVSLFNVDCNGTYFGRAAHTITMEPFDGEVQVTKLRIFPARFHPDHDSMKQKFIERGKKFFQTVKEATYREYIGSTVQGEKRKGVLDINNVLEPRFDPKVMDRLVVDDNKKRMIQAICREYTTLENPAAARTKDIVSGKGEGRIFFLHGSPGVGKTLTAECVAEFTGRPLLTITACDVGITASDVEDNLREFFELSERWRAILLLDEADIYLERRGRNDLERNSVVSVFLRALEYYQGTLFITTNRVGLFDEALKSRIHVSVYYKAFDSNMREKIWDNTFDKLMSERGGDFEIAWNVESYVKHDPEVVNLNWNGREIRNGFQTAVTQAEFDAQGTGAKVRLEKKHLEQVMRMSRAFEEYLNVTHKGDDSFLAKANGYRADDFDKEMVFKVVAHTLSSLAALKAGKAKP